MDLPPCSYQVVAPGDLLRSLPGAVPGAVRPRVPDLAAHQVDGAGGAADPADDVPHDSHLAAGLGLHGDPHHPRHPERFGE